MWGTGALPFPSCSEYAVNRCPLKSHAFLFDEAVSLVEIGGTFSRPDAFRVASNLIAGQG
jgi:hypothetical protein